MRILTVIAAASMVMLSGCGDTEEDTVGGQIADEYTEAMDEAAAIEAKLDDKKADIDAALEQAEVGDED